MESQQIGTPNIIASYFLYNKEAASLSMRVLEVLTNSVLGTIPWKWTAIDITKESLTGILKLHNNLFSMDKKTGNIVLNGWDRDSLREELACHKDFSIPSEVRIAYLGLMKELAPKVDLLVSSEKPPKIH